MKSKKKKDERKNVPGKKEEKHQFETMSQAQNRQGKGRERNGSDGNDQVRGSNH